MASSSSPGFGNSSLYRDPRLPPEVDKRVRFLDCFRPRHAQTHNAQQNRTQNKVRFVEMHLIVKTRGTTGSGISQKLILNVMAVLLQQLDLYYITFVQIGLSAIRIETVKTIAPIVQRLKCSSTQAASRG
jgi:hypothetical protein